MTEKKKDGLKENNRESLIRLDSMYESLRYNEFSTEGGLGEIVDNSVEAQAANVIIDLTIEKVKKENRSKPKNCITQIVVADDGCGMDGKTLGKSLVLGESIRVKGGRRGIGRFGVGMTLGGISLARRIEVYSRDKAEKAFLYTYIDLDEIRDGMLYVPTPIAKNPEQKYEEFLKSSSGTVVVLKKCDRIEGNQEGLANYLGRTYRKFIAAGLNIILDGEKVYLHDPLYMDGPTIFDALGKVKGDIDLKAEFLGESKITLEIPGSNGKTADVVIKMSLLPKEWRLTRGAGGSQEAKKRKIDQNEGISILRAEREVLYGHVPYITGKKGESASIDIDRWWGCEISFPPELDSYFQIRYIKRGAEPVNELRDKIREEIDSVVKTARNRVRKDWQKRQSEDNKEAGVFEQAEKTMEKANSVLPRSKKGQNLSEEQADQKLDDVVNSLKGVADNEKERERKKEELKRKPYSIELVCYPQTVLFDTEHILDSVIIKLNTNHPFFQKVLQPLCGSLDIDEEEGDVERYNKKNKIKDAILLLLFAYAKAEASFSNDDDMCEQLRAQWGIILAAVINRLE